MMPRVTNARSRIRAMSPPVSEVEVESTLPAARCEVQQEAPRLLVLRLWGLQLNTEPFERCVLDGIVRSFRLSQVGPACIECRIDLEFEADALSPLVEVTPGVPVVTRLQLSREPLRRILRGRRITLDPAHGGRDVGARGPINLEERYVVLGVARSLARHLEEAGCRVCLTRHDNRDLSEDDRLQVALASGAEVLIRLHTAHQRDPTCSGARILFAATPGMDLQRAGLLARAIQKALVERLGLADRGVWPTALPPARHGALTPGTSLLCVQAEVVCLSNPFEEAFLRSPTFRDRIAQGIRNGLARFYAEEAGGGLSLAL